jgi:hypothetical protein
MLRSYNTLLELNIEVATGVVKGIRDNSNIMVFKIGGIINIEFLYFTFFFKWKHRFLHYTLSEHVTMAIIAFSEEVMASICGMKSIKFK